MLVQAQAQDDGLVWITAYRCVINAPRDKSVLRDKFLELMQKKSKEDTNGKYGYAHSYVYLVPGNRIAITYLYDHRSAQDCIEVNAQGTSIPINLIKSLGSFTTPTAITVTHHINYLSFDVLEQIVAKSIQAVQGSKTYKHIITSRDSKRHIFQKDGSRIVLSQDGDSAILSIVANPEERKRPMLKHDPIRGTWACEYWTRTVFEALFGFDPLPQNFADLYLFQPAKINRRTGQVV